MPTAFGNYTPTEVELARTAARLKGYNDGFEAGKRRGRALQRLDDTVERLKHQSRRVARRRSL